MLLASWPYLPVISAAVVFSKTRVGGWQPRQSIVPPQIPEQLPKDRPFRYGVHPEARRKLRDRARSVCGPQDLHGFRISV